MDAVTGTLLDEELPRARLALLLEHFSKLEDNREPWRVMYPLKEVLLLVVCGTIASCDDFEDIVAWGKLAEICKQYLGKGRKVYVEGRLRTRDWQAQDGTKRRTTEIICENMIMLDRAPQTGQTFERSPRAPAAPPTIDVEVPALPSASGEEEIRVEDIPF